MYSTTLPRLISVALFALVFGTSVHASDAMEGYDPVPEEGVMYQFGGPYGVVVTVLPASDCSVHVLTTDLLWCSEEGANIVFFGRPALMRFRVSVGEDIAINAGRVVGLTMLRCQDGRLYTRSDARRFVLHSEDAHKWFPEMDLHALDDDFDPAPCSGLTPAALK